MASQAPKALKLFIPGDPVAQGRPRAARRGEHIVVYTAQKDSTWRGECRTVASAAMNGNSPWVGPVKITLHFYFSRPQAHFGKRGLRPSAPILPTKARQDYDNLAKAVTDGLQSLVFADDRQIVHAEIFKHYAYDGQPPGVAIIVEALD